MLKEILLMISQGKTLAEIEREMNVEHSALLGMLETLVRMGYLEVRERNAEEMDVCSSCPLREVCGRNGPKIYLLTERGRRAINK